MAAVLTAVTGSTALLLYITAQDALDREQYTASWPAQSGGVQLTELRYNPATQTQTATQIDPAAVEATFSSELPSFDARVITSTVEMCGDSSCVPGSVTALPPPQNRCFLSVLEREPTDAERRRGDKDWRCTDPGLVISGDFTGTPVGGADLLDLVTGGRSTASAVATLERGGVVVFSRALVRDDGSVTFEVVSDEEALAAQKAGRGVRPRTVSLPATYLPVRDVVGGTAVYSPGAAKDFGQKTRPSVLLMHFDQLPTTDQEEAAQLALKSAGMDIWFGVERGYTSDYGLGCWRSCSAPASSLSARPAWRPAWRRPTRARTTRRWPRSGRHRGCAGPWPGRRRSRSRGSARRWASPPGSSPLSP
jgi:putative ABC transport system permease protein